jgi:hypothetical protein
MILKLSDLQKVQLKIFKINTDYLNHLVFLHYENKVAIAI